MYPFVLPTENTPMLNLENVVSELAIEYMVDATVSYDSSKLTPKEVFERIELSCETGASPLDILPLDCFGYWDWEDIKNHILTEGNDIEKLIYLVLDRTKKGLVKHAIDGKLPFDFNDINLEQLLLDGFNVVTTK